MTTLGHVTLTPDPLSRQERVELRIRTLGRTNFGTGPEQCLGCYKHPSNGTDPRLVSRWRLLTLGVTAQGLCLLLYDSASEFARGL